MKIVYKVSQFVFLHESSQIILHTAKREVFIVEECVGQALRASRSDKSKTRLDQGAFSSSVLRTLIENTLIVSDVDDEIQGLKKRWNHRDRNAYESLHIIPTTRCTLQCDYCFVLSQATGVLNQDISYDTLIKGIDFFFAGNSHTNPLVTFYGGEPLLRSDVIWKAVTYIEKYLGRTIRKRVITNGTELTTEIIERLLDLDFEIGVSIDGMAEAHNKFRRRVSGRSSHGLVVRGAETLSKLGASWNALCTVGTQNIENLTEHVEFLLSLNPAAIALNMPRSLGHETGLDMNLPEATWIDGYLSALALCYEKGVPELHFLKFLHDFFADSIVLRPCSACGSQVAIGPDGRIGPCQAYVMEGKYFIERPPSLAYLSEDQGFQKWAAIDNVASPICRSCELLPLCSDDCVMNRQRRVDDMLMPSTFHCRYRRALVNYFLERCLAGKQLTFGGHDGQ